MIDGILYPDGKVQLGEMPNLAPGRVTVFLQPIAMSRPGQRGLADVIDEIRQGQQARGFQGRSAEEIDSALQEGDDAYEQRMAALQRPASGGPSAAKS